MQQGKVFVIITIYGDKNIQGHLVSNNIQKTCKYFADVVISIECQIPITGCFKTFRPVCLAYLSWLCLCGSFLLFRFYTSFQSFIVYCASFSFRTIKSKLDLLPPELLHSDPLWRLPLLNKNCIVDMGVYEARRKEFRRKEVKREKQWCPETIKNGLY